MKCLSLTHLLFAGSVLPGLGSASWEQKRNQDDGSDDTPLPLLIWHGLGDSYANDGIQHIAQVAEEINPGTLVYTIHLGDANEDRSATFYGNVSMQLEQICAELAAHPILSTAPAVDALGFSQGGLFLRAYVERCNFPPVRSLVTYGSPHNGISKFKDCAASDFLCKGAMGLLKFNIWSDFVQGKVVPAQYYRDPADMDNYLEHSGLLADLNNEGPEKSYQYKNNLARLTNFVMFMFSEDTTLIPKESAWFEDVDEDSVSTPLRGRQMYREDWLGLKELDRKGGITFLELASDHMRITQESLNTTMEHWFGPYKKSFHREAKISWEL